VALQYLVDGYDRFAPAPVDPTLVRAILPGKRLMAGQDCVVCHIVSGEHRIPTYEAIALMYEDPDAKGPDAGILEQLAAKVVQGGAGKWGQTEMPAHPAIPLEDARVMATYVLTQSKEEARIDWRPLRGEIMVDHDAAGIGAGPFGLRRGGRWVLWATYTDNGTAGAPPATGRAVVKFRAPVLLATDRDEATDVVEVAAPGGGTFLVAAKRRSVLKFAALDLTGIRQMTFVVGDSKSDWAGGAIEVRLGSGVGPVIGRAEVRSESAAPVTATAAAAIADTPGVNDLYVVLRGSPGDRKGSVALGAITFQR
jgi:cytochrome c